MIYAPRWLFGAAVLAAVSAFPVQAQQAGGGDAFSSAETEAIESIVRDYLVTHPEVLIEALKAYEAAQREAQAKQQRDAVMAHRELLEGSAGSPVLGNPEGDVLIVEFFDYRCPYCRTVAPTIMETVRQDGGIRLVMKEFPILGPDSVYASRAALAAAMQGKYEAFHVALMAVDGKLTEKAVLTVAGDVGLDVAQLLQDLAAPEVDDALRRNAELANALGIGGTPAFIIGDQLVPGAIGLEDLRSLIDEIRAKAS
jgi:protein-disulfide isomerase